MKGQPVPVEQLRNIGPTIARRLREIGIRTSRDLKAVGPVVAYRRICANYPRRTVPLCYYLYSLEGALRNQHWDALDPKLKQKLVSQVTPKRRLQQTSARGRRKSAALDGHE